jgi:hypothetical protein
MNVHRQSLERIGLRVAAEQDRDLGNPIETDGLMSGIARRRRAANARRAVAVTTFASAIVAVALFVASALRPVPVVAAQHVAPQQPALGARVAVQEDVPLAFVDGTSIAVKRGAHAELRAVSDHGATIALERGTLAIRVVHHDTSRWDIVAGKFDVRVTGTKFDATWDPDTKQLTVAMSEGSVRVTGPCVDEPLAAPSTKSFSCAEEAVSASVDSLPKAPAPEPAPEIETAAKLMDRADAARLSGDAASARRLYLRIRERFSKSAEAAKATFLLGRLAESAGSADEALKWYDTVVRETPRDAYAQESLGRSLALEQARGNAERARSLAADYLRKHPSGPYRAYATSVLESR